MVVLKEAQPSVSRYSIKAIELLFRFRLNIEQAVFEALYEHRLSTGYVMITSDSDSEDVQEPCEAKHLQERRPLSVNLETRHVVAR